MRRASVTVELAVCCAALITLAGMATLATKARLATRQAEARAVALEQAQNVCDELRHGRVPVLPSGWTISRTTAASGAVEAVTVHGPEQIHLTTLVPR
jgi:hypothetical protein